MKLFLTLASILVLAACTAAPQDASGGGPRAIPGSGPAGNMGPGGPRTPADCAVFNDRLPDDSRHSLSAEADAHTSVDQMACESR